MRTIICAAALLCVSCASMPSAPPRAAHKFVAGTPAPILLVGTNDGIGGPVPINVVDRYCASSKLHLYRIPFRSVEQATTQYASVQRCASARIIWLIETKNLALTQQLATWLSDGTQQPQSLGVELGNELDLAGVSSHDFAVFVKAGRDMLRAAGWTRWIITGGIYEVNEGHASYAREALDACADCIFALHWYGDDDDDTMNDVQSYHRLFIVTETGAPSCNKGRNEDTQALFLAERFQRLPQLGNLLGIIVYERASDTSGTDLGCFGTEQPDGVHVKKADDVLQSAIAILTVQP